jgi:hypothetical protein
MGSGRWLDHAAAALNFAAQVAIEAAREINQVNEHWRPKGFHTITPNMIVDDAEAAIAFLKKGLGAVE